MKNSSGNPRCKIVSDDGDKSLYLSGECFLTLLRRAAAAVTEHETRAVKQCSITLNQYIALVVLDAGLSWSSAQVARCLGVSPQASHTLLRRLGQLGLTSRQDDPDTDIVVLHQLTLRGRETLAQARAVLDDVDSGYRDLLTPTTYTRVLLVLEPCLRIGHGGSVPSPEEDARRQLLDMVKSHLGAALRNVATQDSDALALALRSTGLTPGQYHILAAIDAASLTPTSRIVSQAAVPQQTASAILNRFVLLGFVERDHLRTHATAVAYRLTDAGLDARDQAQSAAAAVQSRRQDDFSSADRRALIPALNTLANALTTR
ncbi:MAG: MarR family winged helix-turn-helix transcriptional regulator [Propionibacteriaceae bacterium]|nr:MarR family winged helix-turn-helix transcriptional regulator [Propionibacteriaceae bacterium]